ncbi:hypothetical protein BJX99DRAFT_233538 [Aspergillus californicus]
MVRKKKSSQRSHRDESRLSGKPLAETIGPSPLLSNASETWVTSPDLTEYKLPFTIEDTEETSLFLLANPALGSTVLFRADILFDSGGAADSTAGIETETQAQSEAHDFQSNVNGNDRKLEGANGVGAEPRPARDVPGFELMRTVVRRMIPRNSQLDCRLEQTVHFYRSSSSPSSPSSVDSSSENSPCRRLLAIYTPHVSKEGELPFYHPFVQSLAYSYEHVSPSHMHSSSEQPELDASISTDSDQPDQPDPTPNSGSGTISIHFLPKNNEIPNRLGRVLSNLININIRLTRSRRRGFKSPYSSMKDNVIPRYRSQDTYSRLKVKYSADLCGRWVENTEPSKHVFEDLSIAAFLIELWRDMYGVVPVDERSTSASAPLANITEDSDLSSDSSEAKAKFPGFVDIACGNGLLVYILIQEGYRGWGFDARRRKTWSIFPDKIQQCLKEETYIPEPFADELPSPSSSLLPSSSSPDFSALNDGYLMNPSVKTHTAAHPSTFPTDIFIISNHADELTLWTPLLASLINPINPPPFFAIPCCSHSLSGARYRYSPPPLECTSSGTVSVPVIETKAKAEPPSTTNSDSKQTTAENTDKTGSLKTLRKTHQESRNPASDGFNKSTYGALTAKLVSMSQELGYEAVKTLVRIPSTRNIAVLGNVHTGKFGGRSRSWLGDSNRHVQLDDGKGVVSLIIDPALQSEREKSEKALAKVHRIVQRECARDGGIKAAARMWVERACGLSEKVHSPGQ